MRDRMLHLLTNAYPEFCTEIVLQKCIMPVHIWTLNRKIHEIAIVKPRHTAPRYNAELDIPVFCLSQFPCFFLLYTIPRNTAILDIPSKFAMFGIDGISRFHPISFSFFLMKYLLTFSCPCQFAYLLVSVDFALEIGARVTDSKRFILMLSYCYYNRSD